MARSGERGTELLERGEILFYRPRVEDEDPSGLGDVQRFYVVLRPDRGGKLRLLVLGRKRLPAAGAHERVWGFVDLVTDDAGALERSLHGGAYETKTRGERHQPAARPAGAGAYAVSLEDGRMHLSYALGLPGRPADVQRAFVAPEASYALSVKNPKVGQPRGTGLAGAEKADFPEDLQRKFHGRRFAAEDVRLLDVEGAEFMLVGAHEDPERAYGLGLDTPRGERHRAEIDRELRDLPSRHPTEPLLGGRWD
ncbi:MAG TPA: hypothetical protein VE684_05455 [Crenalkalicoccus sp.]|nr:hypothetical protein [Crenalkalicoccus sp.]